MKGSFICAVVICLAASIFFWASAVQNGLAEDLVRFHVIANSDLPYDQELKLTVRDAVVGYAESLTRGVTARADAEAVLTAHLSDIENIANHTLKKRGVPYTATAKLSNQYFPTKSYANFRLPAGEYRAVTLTLGEGKGKNFWCVLFPPLCLSPVSFETVATDLTEEEKTLIANGDTPTRYRFFLVEAAGKLKQVLN